MTEHRRTWWGFQKSANRHFGPLFIVAPWLIVGLLSTPAYAQRIASVSIPEGSMDSTCRSLDDNVWSVSVPPYPFDVTRGIGVLVNPEFFLGGENYTLHDHQYVEPHIPDPTRAIVTFEFDKPVVVNKIEVIQHANGITRLEGFVGDSRETLGSIGAVFGPLGDIAGDYLFAEGQPYTFEFDNTQAGRFFQIVIRKTSLADGWASYRWYPVDRNGNRITPADGVGGTFTGFNPERGVLLCENLTTRQGVRMIVGPSTSWNCANAGLAVSPGDRVSMQLLATGTVK